MGGSWCEIATYTVGWQEREKINQSNSREELAGGGPANPLPESGGRGEGKGAKSVPEMASPTKLQTGFQFLTKDFLRFWMVDIRREGHA